MKRLLMSLLCIAAASLFAGTEYFVDAVNGNDDWDGQSAVHTTGDTGPKRTLAAVTTLVNGLSDSVPVVITAAPGCYSNGTVTAEGQANRFAILRKDVKLRSSAGKDRTFIVGAHDPTASDGIGPAAVRCGFVQKDLLGNADKQSKSIVIEGFTVCNGAVSATTGNDVSRGGGIYCASPETGGYSVIDCTVSNCVAVTGGGLFRARAYQTLIVDNYATSSGSASAFGYSINCVVAFNRGKYASYNQSLIVNSTLVGNEGYPIQRGYGVTVKNSILFGNEKGNGCPSDGVYVYFQNSVASAPCHFNDYTGSDKDAPLTNAAPFQCVSTAFWDWRLLAGSEAIGTGLGSNLKDVTLPDGYVHRDILGHVIDTSGAIDCGAVQASAVTPTGGRIDFVNDTGVTELARFRRKGGAAFGFQGSYHYVTEGMKTVELAYEPVSGRPCLMLWTSEDVNRHLIPRYDGYVSFLEPQAPGSVLTVTGSPARSVRYVDAVNGNDDWDGSAPVHEKDTNKGPKLTLQGAVLAVKNDKSLVYAAPGLYDKGESGIYTENVWMSNRVNTAAVGGSVKTIGFVSSGGIGKAIVKGAPDPTTGGLGPAALRIAYMTSGSYFQGFVLTGGYTPDVSSAAGRGGVAYCGAGQYAQFADCIISNNHAGVCGSLYLGDAVRSRFADNHSRYGEAFRQVRLYSCQISDEKFDEGNPSPNLFLGNCRVVMCTIDAGGGPAWNSTASPEVRGCILYDSTVDGTSTDRNFIARPKSAKQPDFASRADRDYRLGVLSPAIGYMSKEEYLRFGDQHYPCDDIDGRPLVWRDGKATVGAFDNAPFLPSYSVEGAGGGVSVTGGSTGHVVVREAAEVTATATDTEMRPFVGFEVNGVMRSAAETSYTFAAPTDPGAALVVRAVYGTDWYVRDNGGSDGNSGGTLETAKKTIVAAAELAKSGDVIHVDEGVYRDGSSIHTSACDGDNGTQPITIRSRVKVNAGVTIESLKGAERTIIVGEPAPVPEDAYGNGAGAIRCAVLAASTSVLRGFTLTGGHTAVGPKARDDIEGGGAIVKSSGLVENCIISNNFACRCGAGYKGYYLNCRIVGNVATDRASVGREATYLGCFIDGNIGAQQPIQYFSRIDGCTIGAGNVDFDGNQATAIAGLNGPPAAVVNTLVLADRIDSTVTNLAHSAVVAGCGIAAKYLTDCVVTNVESLAIDAEGRPVVGSNAGIDRADPELSNAMIRDQTVDLSGFQRVMNGARDIGAFEADWRPRYGRDLGSKVRVASASPEVYEGEGRKVAIPTGSLACTVAAAGDYNLAFAVTGNGSLNVYRGDGLLASYAQGEYAVPVKAVAADTPFRFEYVPGTDDTGCAELCRFKADVGLMLIVR